MEASEAINTSQMTQNDNSSVKSKLLSGEFKINAKRGRSEVWKVFGSIENACGEEIPYTVACRDCFNVYKFKTSTSNLVKHKCYIEASTGQIIPKVEVDNITKTPFINLCTKWTVENCRPFKILEDSGFTIVAEYLIATGAKYGPNVDVQSLLPQPTSLTRSISKCYQNHFQNVKTEIASIKSNGFSLTFDLWKDDYFKKNYMALAIQYVKEGVLRNKLLGLKCMEAEKCTSEKVKKKVCKILKNFDLDLDDKSVIVSDQGSSMVAGFRGCNHIYYIDQLLHITVQKSMQDIDEVAELCRMSCKLVKHLKTSGLNENLNTSLKSFSPTRWNSIYSLLVSIEANWNSMYETLENRNELNKINKINIKDIKAITNVLQPFQEAFLKLEGEKYATIHFVYMIVHHLQKKCALVSSDLDIARKLKEKLNGNLSTTILNNLTVFHKIAVYLFPPANKLLKFSQEEKTEIKDECRRIMSTYVTEVTDNDEENQDTDEDKDPVHDFFVEYLQSNQNDEIGAELLKYETVSIPKFTNEFNVLEWWNLHKLEYPLLYKLSCKILGTPTSSAASDRVFSAARNLISEKRCVIASNDNILNEIVFLHSNIITN